MQIFSLSSDNPTQGKEFHNNGHSTTTAPGPGNVLILMTTFV